MQRCSTNSTRAMLVNSERRRAKRKAWKDLDMGVEAY